MSRNKANSDLVGTGIWSRAYTALKTQDLDAFLRHLEQLRRHFILKTAADNYEIVSRRDLLAKRNREFPSSPNADTFVGLYKRMHPTIDDEELATKRAYITHYDLAGYLGASLQRRLDPRMPDYANQLSNLIRRELFSKILTEFLPALVKNKAKSKNSSQNSVRPAESKKLSYLSFNLLALTIFVLIAGIVCAILSGLHVLPALPFLTELSLGSLTFSAAIVSTIAIALTSICIGLLGILVALKLNTAAVSTPRAEVKAAPAAPEPCETEDERIKNMQKELMHSELSKSIYTALSEPDKENIVRAMNADFSLTLSVTDTESLLSQMKLAISAQPAIQDGVRIDERDCREIDALLIKRQSKVAEDGVNKQVETRLFYTASSPYLGISLTEEQILAVLDDKASIELTEAQIEEILTRVGRKCDEFSPANYENLTSFIRNRKINIPPDLKAAMIKQYVGLERPALDVFLALKREDLTRRLEYRRLLDEFVAGIEIVTVEDLKNASLIALGKTLTRLQSAQPPQWLSWVQPLILTQKIRYVEETITAVKSGGAGASTAALMGRLTELSNSRLLATHRNVYSALFHPAVDTQATREMKTILAECAGSEAQYHQEYEKRFRL